MSGFIDTLTGILSLEARRGYGDSAVVGGLSKFTAFIEKNGTEEHFNVVDIHTLVEVFNQYATLSKASRQDIVPAVVKWLKNAPLENRLSLPKMETEASTTSSPSFPQSPAVKTQDKALYGSIEAIR
jgi:hypothetical protein